MNDIRTNLQNTPDPDGVQRERVAFDSGGVQLAGILFHPADVKSSVPGAIVTGAWTTVKEQMAGTYARGLAARGIAALAFDFRGWGESAGEVRYKEDPEAKTADIMAAADYMDSRSDIDSGALGGVGICASSGYMASAVADHPALSRLALLAAWLHDPATAAEIYGGPESVAALVDAGRQAEADGTVITAASSTDEDALMYQAPYYTETDRGLIAAYDNRFHLASWEPWLTYDAQASADRLAAPTLIVCSEAAALPAGAHAYAERLASPPDQLWLDDVSQFDFYDRADIVAQATDAIARHLVPNNA